MRKSLPPGPTALAVLCIAMSMQIAHAEDSDSQALQKEVEELRREVKDLQEQVKTLKTEPLPAATSQPKPAPARDTKPAKDSIAELRESWSRVDRGMTKDQIASVLGAPTKELTIDGKLVWYYYYAGIGGASVFFYGDGHVSSKQRPTVGWW